MLNAVLAGKKRGTGLEGQRRLLDQAEGAEDVLTASVFERLSYLSDSQFSAVMSALLQEPFGPLRDIEYWPSWYLQDGARVEPDVVLRDNRRTLLVEAKRHDNLRQQSARQLANELTAGWREGCLPDDCLLLTLGGMDDLGEMARAHLQSGIEQAIAKECRRPFKLICRSWQQLFQAVRICAEANASAGESRLVEDLGRCFAWHGLRTHPMRWLDGLLPAGINTSSGAFSAWSLE
ncbi:F-box domain-containing protein [Pseudomonas sp. PDM21]|uniref:F-box domain-containing protein n=1 Tax=Pseudomonas sp. PDM21 TaxID=2769257 RepID=UPI001781A246|nr:F-box domain-containing protein [Pseudomonas sp. PDM21]MBD9673953.1 F-box domain-containing protein [Pseudomonas sp. PDM21]